MFRYHETSRELTEFLEVDMENYITTLTLNHYLYISESEDGSLEISSSDGVFSSIARRDNKEGFQDYCKEKADDWLSSNLGNYSGIRAEKRKLVSDKWLAARNLSPGKYEYYFNTENPEDIFREQVALLAKSLGIPGYTLDIK